MTGFLRRLRGLLGLSAVGGTVGGILGVVYAFVTSFLGLGSIAFGSVGWTAALWAGFGAAAAGGVGLVLATLESRRSLGELSAGRAALGGAVVGALAPLAVVFALTGGIYVSGVSFVAGLSGLLGAGLGAGFVSMAKRAEKAELGRGEDRGELGP